MFSRSLSDCYIRRGDVVCPEKGVNARANLCFELFLERVLQSTSFVYVEAGSGMIRLRYFLLLAFFSPLLFRKCTYPIERCTSEEVREHLLIRRYSGGHVVASVDDPDDDALDLRESDSSRVRFRVVVAFDREVDSLLVFGFVDDAVDDDAVRVLALVRDDVADVDLVVALRDDFERVRLLAQDWVHAVRGRELRVDRVLHVDDDAVLVHFDLRLGDVVARRVAADRLPGEAGVELARQFCAVGVRGSVRRRADGCVRLARRDSHEEGGDEIQERGGELHGRDNPWLSAMHARLNSFRSLTTK